MSVRPVWHIRILGLFFATILLLYQVCIWWPVEGLSMLLQWPVDRLIEALEIRLEERHAPMRELAEVDLDNEDCGYER